MSAVFRARDSMDALVEGDVYVVFDAFRHGNENEIARCFRKESDGKTMTKDKRTVYMFYEQESLASFRGLTRGATVIHQMEFCHLFSATPLNTGPEEDRVHYKGTNKGDCIGC